MRTIVHLSDLHFGRIDPAIVGPLRDAVVSLKPDLVAISGDFTQRARRAQFRAARQFLDALPLRLLVVPGNHDVPLYDVVERFAAPLNRYRRYVSSELEPEYVDEEMIVLGVNTARSWVFPLGEGRINEQQVNRIIARLRAVSPALLRVIVTHHPFDLPPGVGTSRILGRSDMAMARLTEANADLFLSGHLHISHVSSVIDRYAFAGHSGLIVHAGTVSTRGRGESPSFNVLRLARPEIVIDRHAWTGSSFEPERIGRYHHAVDGWRRD